MIHLFHVVAGGLLLAVAGVATATDDWAQQDQQATAAYRVGDYVTARDHALQALAIAERDHADGPGAARLASSLNALALVLQASGDDDGARPLLERAVTVAAQALGDLQVLAARGRRAVRGHLGADVTAGLARLTDMVQAASEAAPQTDK